MLFEYSYIQNNGQKTKWLIKWLIQITENYCYGSDQRERMYDPELFGISISAMKKHGKQ